MLHDGKAAKRLLGSSGFSFHLAREITLRFVGGLVGLFNKDLWEN